MPTNEFSDDELHVFGAILEREGELTPETVLDAARDPSSPLHHLFEWNDAKAAAQWRSKRL